MFKMAEGSFVGLPNLIRAAKVLFALSASPKAGLRFQENVARLRSSSPFQALLTSSARNGSSPQIIRRVGGTEIKSA